MRKFAENKLQIASAINFPKIKSIKAIKEPKEVPNKSYNVLK